MSRGHSSQKAHVEPQCLSRELQSGKVGPTETSTPAACWVLAQVLCISATGPLWLGWPAVHLSLLIHRSPSWPSARCPRGREGSAPARTQMTMFAVCFPLTGPVGRGSWGGKGVKAWEPDTPGGTQLQRLPPPHGGQEPLPSLGASCKVKLGVTLAT